MAMSKKDFIELADTVRAARPVEGTPSPATHWGAAYQWEFMRNRLADFCGRQNPRSIKARWISYIDGECGPSGGRVKDGDGRPHPLPMGVREAEAKRGIS